MQFIGGRRERRVFVAKGAIEIRIFAVTTSYVVDFIVVLKVTQMYLIRCNADNRALKHKQVSIYREESIHREIITVYLMQFLNFQIETTSAHEAVVGLIQPCDSCQLGARNLG